MIIKKNKARGEAVRGDDYIYASAMVRTRALKRIDREALLRLAEARDVDEICKILPEYSIDPVLNENGTIDTEETVVKYLAGEFDTVSKAMPQRAIIDFLRIPYDCHNLKSLAKCDFRDRERAEALLIDLGRVPAMVASGAVKEGKLSLFSKNLASSYEKAKAAFAESGDPKLIDAVLDTACYADMLSAVGSYRNDYFKKLVKVKIDTTNLMTAVRTLRMGDTTGLFENMFLGGSDLDLKFFKDAMDGGEKSLFEAMKKKGYRVFTAEDESPTLTQIGKYCEDAYMQCVDSAKDVSFGAEVCVCYLIKQTHATQLLRTVVAAKQAGIESAKIKEKIGKF